jgi:hypothetical protein
MSVTPAGLEEAGYTFFAHDPSYHKCWIDFYKNYWPPRGQELGVDDGYLYNPPQNGGISLRLRRCGV